MNGLLAALINGALLSAVVAAVVWFGMRMARRFLNAATRYVVWWVALGVTVLLPAVYLPKAQRVESIPAPASEGGALPLDAGAFENGVAWQKPPAAAEEVAGSAIQPAVGRPGLLRRFWASFPIEIPAGRWPQGALAAWVCASVLMLARLIRSWVVLQRRGGRAPDSPEPWRSRADGWLASCGSSRRGVRLACAAGIAMPAAIGPLHPTILIPARLFEQMDEEALDQIGLHEAAHLARRDDYSLVLQRLIEALFALHPVVRWIGRQIELEREIACDDFVLAVTGKSRSYASCLARMVELTAGASVSPAAAAAGSHLARRVEMLFDKTRHAGTRLLKARLTAVVAAVALLAFTAAQSPGLLAFGTPQGLPAIALVLAKIAAPDMMQQPAAPQPATAAPGESDGRCSVTGKVVDAATGAPLRDVKVVFRAEADGATFTASTGDNGAFEAAPLEPGVYTITATGSGYLVARYGARLGQPPPPFTLAPGQKATGIDLRLLRPAIISGRVLNADGDPVANQVVSPMLTVYWSGSKDLISAALATTNDLGEYRLENLSPGSYYLYSRGASPLPDRSAKPREEEDVATYYPTAAKLQGAVPVEVKPGQILQGINVKLARARTTRISGRVSNLSSQPGPISLVLENPNDYGFGGNRLQAGPKGEFEFRGILPGSYTISANVGSGYDTRHAGRFVQAGEVPVENVTLTLTDGLEIPGTVTVDGDEQIDLPSLRVRLSTPWVISAGDGPSPRVSQPDEEGNFKIAGVNPNRYIAAVNSLPDGWYIKSLRMGMEDVLEGGIDLVNGGAAPLQIVLSAKGSAIAGTVSNSKGAPAAAAIVALVPQEPGRQGKAPFYRSLYTDLSGGFRMKGVPPGEYKLYAWTEVDMWAWVDPEFLKPYAAKAKAVTLREGDALRVELQVIPAPE